MRIRFFSVLLAALAIATTANAAPMAPDYDFRNAACAPSSGANSASCHGMTFTAVQPSNADVYHDTTDGWGITSWVDVVTDGGDEISAKEQAILNVGGLWLSAVHFTDLFNEPLLGIGPSYLEKGYMSINGGPAMAFQALLTALPDPITNGYLYLAFTPTLVNTISFWTDAYDIRHDFSVMGLDKAPDMQPVPEPASLTLLGIGLIAGARRIRNSRRRESAPVTS